MYFAGYPVLSRISSTRPHVLDIRPFNIYFALSGISFNYIFAAFNRKCSHHGNPAQSWGQVIHSTRKGEMSWGGLFSGEGDE